MKRCPQCNRVETDDALVYCRVDGTALISESSSLSSEAGAAQPGSPSAPTEIETSILPHKTDATIDRETARTNEIETSVLPQRTGANINRATSPTTVLPPQPSASTTDEFRITTKTRLNRRALVVIGTAIVAAVTAAIVISYRTGSRRAAINSIAVMPFVNESDNADVEYLSDGMTETLIGSLSQLPNLNVKARSTVFRYKGKSTDAKTIGKELNVQAVLNGRVMQRGDQLTLSLELVNAETENVIWSEQYNRKTSRSCRAAGRDCPRRLEQIENQTLRYRRAKAGKDLHDKS